MKRTISILSILLFIISSLEGQYQTIPTLEELKTLRSIKGKMQGSIVWSTSRHGNWDIYKMKADGTEKVRLTNDKEWDSWPVWSKDGRWIYYHKDRDIYRMRSDGTEAEMVVEDVYSFDLSEDSLKLIYVKEEGKRYWIVLHDIETEVIEEIVPARFPEFNGKKFVYPTVSPDYKWIAFSSDYPRPWTIHIVNTDGSKGNVFARGCQPHYRPDGQMVVWITSGSHNVYIGTPDGKEQKPFENSIPGRPHCYFPRWSNDGEYIVFAASPHRDRGTSDYEIYIKPFSGGKAVRLTFHPRTDAYPDVFFLIVYPPINFSGKKVSNRALFYAEYINVLSWQSNPNNYNIAKYRIYVIEKGTQKLLVELDASLLNYSQRNVDKDKSYTYAISTLNNEDIESNPTYITIQ